MIKYINGDLFTSKNSLAHAISLDFKMGAGIAKIFRRKYIKQILKARNEMIDIEKSLVDVGKCLIVDVGEHYVFNLITKKLYYQKPTLKSMESSLKNMFEKAKALDVKAISAPRIGCGLDRLKWNDVEKLIIKHQGNIDVTVYSL